MNEKRRSKKEADMLSHSPLPYPHRPGERRPFGQTGSERRFIRGAYERTLLVSAQPYRPCRPSAVHQVF